MSNTNKNTASEKLDNAIENFGILKDNIDNFSVKEQLEMASAIRDNLSTDEWIIAACADNPELSAKRKQLLDSIRKMQMDLIEENDMRDEDISYSKCSVGDFDKAKDALSEMIDEELKTNMFSEKDSLALCGKIKECESHVNTLKQVSSVCKYGKYKVLLMGDFQSGKTTTFNAFCEGRHIGAIGKGIATSAVLLSATYAEKESLIIHWRQKEHFCSIFERIKQYLQDFDWSSFDIGIGSSREKLLNEIEALRQSKNCPNVGKGDSKFLMLCSFILKYYDTKDLREKQMSLDSLSAVSGITKFPEDGEELWMKNGVEKFSIDEIIFVFIDKVDCFVPSKILKDLNCTIIDSPGLFNSTYDTMVTEDVMREANAIMYILPYYKGMGKDVCQTLYAIKDNYTDVHRKLFIVNNLILTDDNNFYDSNCRQIESMFNAEKHVCPYDGKLAYLTELKKLYLSGLASTNDYRHLMSVKAKSFGKKTEIVFEKFEDAWIYHTKKYEIEDKSFDEIPKLSGFEGMLGDLKQFIANNESYAVIVSNGLMPMRHEMVSVENGLFRSYIEPYNTSRDRLAELWTRRIDVVTNFQEYVKNETEKFLFGTAGTGSSLLDRMADEEYAKLFTYDFYTELSEKIAGVLYDNKKKLMATKALFKSDKAKFKKWFIERATPLIELEISSLIASKIDKLVKNMEHDQDKTVENMFAPVIGNLKNKLMAEWNKQFEKAKDKIPMENYLAMPLNLSLSDKHEENSGNEELGMVKYNLDNFSDGDVSASLLGGIVAEVSAVVAGAASLIAGYIVAIMWDPTGISQISVSIGALFLGLGGTIVSAIAPNLIRDHFIKVVSKKIDPDVRKNAVEGFKMIVKVCLKKRFSQYTDNLVVDLNKLKNERDVALSPNANQELLCFMAFEMNARIHEQIMKYDKFKTTYLKDETH